MRDVCVLSEETRVTIAEGHTEDVTETCSASVGVKDDDLPWRGSYVAE